MSTIILRGMPFAELYCNHFPFMIFSASQAKLSNFYRIAAAANVNPEEGSNLAGTRVVWLPRCAAAAAAP